MGTLTVLDDRDVTVDARIDGAHVWIAAADLTAVTGWERKPEGMCRGPVCMPVREPIDGADGNVDLVAVARVLGKDVAVDADRGVVALADDPMARGEVRNLHELSLPGRDGRIVDLSGLAGKKVVLIAWASW